MFNSNVDLLKGKIFKALIIFAVPIFISSLFQQLYNTVDIMIVGNYLGDSALAAIGASVAVYEVLVGFALGIGGGLSIVTSRGYGSGNEKLVKKSVAGSLVIGVGITIIIMIISALFLKPLLVLLNTPVDIIDEAYKYVYIISMSVGVMFLYNLAAGLLRAIGNSLTPLIFLIVSSILNIGLDILFITKFNMGVEGAAYATVLAQGISGVLCVIYILYKCPLLIPKKEHFIFDKALYKDLLGQGISMGMMGLIVSVGTLILQVSINSFGALTIAGHTAARKIGAIGMIPIIAIAMSLSTFVSQNKGANQGDRIIKAVYLANMMAIGVGAVMTVIIVGLAPIIVKTLSGSTEAELINTGVRYIRFNVPCYAILGILLNLRNALQGIGEKVLPLISSIIEFLGKIVFVILFIPSLKYFGVIICEPIIWIFMTLQLMYSFYKNPYIKSFRKAKVS